jgi:hypothetical protein
VAAGACAVAALAVLIAYAALLPSGKWQGDDYLGAWLVAGDGWHVLVDRIAGRSPRPVAETLSWLYFSASNALGRPVIGYFLALLWMAALVGVAATARAGRVRRPILIALVLFALALLLIKPGEMFYWPEGAAAYVPCWAGLAAATVLHRADIDRHTLALVVALLVAAFSAEIGAITVLLYTALVGTMCLGGGSPRPLRPLILPALGSLAVCLGVLHGRMLAAGEVLDPASGLAGNWPASLRAALPQFARESVSVEGLPLLAGAAIKLLVMLCLPPTERLSPSGSRRAALWACALLVGAFVSIMLAYHEFGTLCCERHATLRQGMVLLALASFGGLLGSALPVPRLTVLAALLLALLGLRAGALSADWHAMPDVLAARRHSWAAAASPGDAMTLFLAPPSQITNSDALPAGQYHRTADGSLGDTPWYAWGIMARFGKHALDITTMDPRAQSPSFPAR